jgi:hypothetical protein
LPVTNCQTLREEESCSASFGGEVDDDGDDVVDDGVDDGTDVVDDDDDDAAADGDDRRFLNLDSEDALQ